MKAILVKQPGGAEQLYLGDAPTPGTGSDELRIHVAATALNRADLMQREGKYPPPEGASEILGLELAGTVESVGEDCTGWKVGDRVCGLLEGGGYAEYAVLPCRMAIPIPEGMSFEAAAAIPEVFLTAFQSLFWLGDLQGGQRVLIHAGASGVGTAAIQLARSTGAHVYVTASPQKHARCLELGAERAIDYKHEDFAERILAATEGRGVDLILDFIGASYFAQNIRSLALDGRLIMLAMMGGSRVEEVNLGAIFRKRARIIATTLRSRSRAYKIALTRDFVDRFLSRFEDGSLRPVVDSAYDWNEVQAAHQYMEANKNVGKVVLRISG